MDEIIRPRWRVVVYEGYRFSIESNRGRIRLERRAADDPSEKVFLALNESVPCIVPSSCTLWRHPECSYMAWTRSRVKADSSSCRKARLPSQKERTKKIELDTVCHAVKYMTNSRKACKEPRSLKPTSVEIAWQVDTVSSTAVQIERPCR